MTCLSILLKDFRTKTTKEFQVSECSISGQVSQKEPKSQQLVIKISIIDLVKLNKQIRMVQISAHLPG